MLPFEPLHCIVNLDQILCVFFYIEIPYFDLLGPVIQGQSPPPPPKKIYNNWILQKYVCYILKGSML